MAGKALVGVELEHPPLAAGVGQQRVVRIDGAQWGEVRWNEHTALLLPDHLVRVVGKINLCAAGEIAPPALIPVIMVTVGEPLDGTVDDAAAGCKQAQVIAKVLGGDGIALLLIEFQERAVGVGVVGIGAHVNNHGASFLSFCMRYVADLRIHAF